MTGFRDDLLKWLHFDHLEFGDLDAVNALQIFQYFLYGVVRELGVFTKVRFNLV